MCLLGCQRVCWQHWAECDSPFCFAVHLYTCCTYMFILHDFICLTPVHGHKTLVIFLETGLRVNGVLYNDNVVLTMRGLPPGLATMSIFALTAENSLNSLKLGAVKIHGDHETRMETALLLLPGLSVLCSSTAEQNFIPHFLFWSTSNCQKFRPGHQPLWAAPVYSSQAVTHENTQSRCSC